MREDILVKKIGDVCEVIPGQSPKSKFYNDEGDGLPFYQGKKRFTEKFLDTPVIWTTNITKEAIDGDILMSVRAPVGPVNFATQKICIGRGLAAIRPKEKIDRNYLFYFFLKNEADLESTSGAVFDSINSKQIRNIYIPIPPLPEQKRIVAILDEAFEAIDRARANIEKNIENAEELFQSKLNEIFEQRGEGWEEKTLKQVSIEFGRGKSKHRPRNDEKLYGGKYPFVQTGDIRKAKKTLSEFSQTYNETGLKQSKLWPKGTICITIAANIAESAILDFDGCFPDSVIGLIIDPNQSESGYAYYALQYLKAEIQAKGKGSAQDNINLGTFKELYFPFPDLNIQYKIVKMLDCLLEDKDLLVQAYQKKLKFLVELKKSILQKAFSGELTTEEAVVA